MNQLTTPHSRLWGSAIGGRAIHAPEDIRQLLTSEDLWSENRSACQTARAWVRANQTARGIPPGVSAVLSDASEWSDASVAAAIFECPTRLDTAKAPSMSDVMVVCKLSSGPGVIAVEGKAGEDFGPLVSDWLPEEENSSSRKPARFDWACNLLGLDSSDNDKNLRWQLFHRTASAILQAHRFEARHAIMLVHDFTCDAARDHFNDFENFGQRLGFSIARNAITEAKMIDDISLRLAWVSDKLQPA